MRKRAMALHTREQAPKEGGVKAEAPLKQAPWVPTPVGYARFLDESKIVFGTFESIMAAADGHPECEFCFGVDVDCAVQVLRAGKRAKRDHTRARRGRLSLSPQKT